MSDESRSPAAVLERRRLALIARCSAQRIELKLAGQALSAPFSSGALRQALGGSYKVPLIVAGVGLGLLATRPSRALSLLQSGMALWGTVGTVLGMLRKARANDVS